MVVRMVSRLSNCFVSRRRGGRLSPSFGNKCSSRALCRLCGSVLRFLCSLKLPVGTGPVPWLASLGDVVLAAWSLVFMTGATG